MIVMYLWLFSNRKYMWNFIFLGLAVSHSFNIILVYIAFIMCRVNRSWMAVVTYIWVRFEVWSVLVSCKR
jgi:Gpi18-like mannosyltransferase